MSVERVALRNLTRITDLLDDERETLLAVRTDPGGATLGARLVGRIERLASRAIALLAVDEAFVSEEDFALRIVHVIGEDLSRARDDFATAGIHFQDVEPFDMARASRPAVALADWFERLARRVGTRVLQLVVLLAPAEVADAAAFASMMQALAGATVSGAVKYVVLDASDAPLVSPAQVDSARLAGRELGEVPPADVFASPTRRLVVLPRAYAASWSEEWLQRLRPSRLVSRTLEAHDRWTFFTELDEAVDSAFDAVFDTTVDAIDHEPTFVAPRAELAVRFAEKVEWAARQQSPTQNAVVRIDIADGDPELVRELVASLARAASSTRVRYIVFCDAPVAVPQRSVGVHRVRFDVSDVIAGYEEQLADPQLPDVPRARALCMLSGFVVNGPDRANEDTRRRSIELAAEAVELAGGSPLEHAMALLCLGNAMLTDAQDGLARDAYARATASALEAKNLSVAAQALGQVGVAHGRLGAFEEAAKSFRSASAAFRKVSHALGEGQMLLWLGDAERRRGDWEAAAAAWLEAAGRGSELQPLMGETAAGLAAQAHERLAHAFSHAGLAGRATEHEARARELGGVGRVVEPF